MKKLLLEYSLNSDMQYYEMIVASFHKGHFSNAYSFFDMMPRANRIAFLKSATVGGWVSGLGDHKIAQLFDRL
jgi:hypothetical protein